MTSDRPWISDGQGCFACHNDMPEGEECAVCGRGAPEPPKPEPERSPLQEAIRKARGDVLPDEVPGLIEAFNRGQRGESDFKVTDLGNGRFRISTQPSPNDDDG